MDTLVKIGFLGLLENWSKVFEKYKQYLDENTIFVGHSLGVPFILTILEGLEKLVKASVSLLRNPIFDEINKTFVEREFDWER